MYSNISVLEYISLQRFFEERNQILTYQIMQMRLIGNTSQLTHCIDFF